MRANYKYITIVVFWCIAIAWFDGIAKQKAAKYKVENVVFVGNNSFSDKRLIRTMITRSSSFFSKRFFYKDVFEEDLKSLISFYNRNGFLEVTIEERVVKIDTLKNSCLLRIKIHEGELTKIEGISIFGHQIFSEKKLQKKINIKEGDPFRQGKIQDARVALLTMYADNGFIDAEVNPEIKINADIHRAIIDFLIQEGFQYKIGQIKIKGIEKIKEKIVKRELLFHSGQLISYSSLLKSQRNLYLTGLYQSVFIRPQTSDNDSSTKDILIEIKEKQAGEFNVAVGFGSIDRLMGRIEVYNTNLAGTARKIGLSFKKSFVNQGIEASFTEPYTYGFRWKTDVGFKYDFLDEPGYNINRVGGRVTVGRVIKDRSNIFLNFRHDRTRLSEVKVSKIPEKLISNVRSLKLSIIYDNRDNIFNSTHGCYLEWNNELAGSFLSGSDSFLRSVGRAKYFKLLGRSTVLATAFEIGWMDVFAGSKEIPLNERFYAGGPNSLRGFKYRAVGPLGTNSVEVGGQFQIIWNAIELRRSLYKMVGTALFIDIGNVWGKAEYMNWKHLRLSPGIGVRINTPLGIARVDYGFAIDPKKDEPSGMLYFNMGQAF